MFAVAIIVVALAVAPHYWLESETRLIEEAIMTKEHDPAFQFRIKVDKVSGEYARAIVSSADGKGETEVAYLQKEGGRWVVLDQGTGVNPHEIGIPDEW